MNKKFRIGCIVKVVDSVHPYTELFLNRTGRIEELSMSCFDDSRLYIHLDIEREIPSKQERLGFYDFELEIISTPNKIIKPYGIVKFLESIK